MVQEWSLANARALAAAEAKVKRVEVADHGGQPDPGLLLQAKPE